IDVPPILLRNETPRKGHWTKLRLLNRHGSPALQARVLVSTGEKTQLRELRSGSTYQSQSAFDLHFGLGEASAIDSIEILWPGGRRTVLKAQAADTLLTIREPVEPGPAPAGEPGDSKTPR
ncbi:ASPIC/UnbV domain-containing protein, partial [Singulisphaera rosea]